ncbi:MAG: PDZ domain-containing protein [Candidatus Rokuibacteriota bacterium]
MGDRGYGLLLAVVLALCLVSVGEARPWAWLGVRIRDISEQEMESVAARHGIREGFGVVVVEVIEETPAARAGLKSGDLVVALNGRPVTETRLLQRLIAAAGADTDVRLTVLRPEGRQPFTVRLTTMPTPLAGDRVGIEFGFVLRESEPQAEAAGARGPAGRPAVGVVIPGSAAVRAGLEVGDTILEINDTSVPTREAARDVLAELELDRPLRLVVRRGETQRALTLSIAERG